MIERTATIASTVGLHARPASIFADAAGELEAEVSIARVGEPAEDAVGADSMLALMSLGVEHGEVVVLRTDDDSAGEALDALVRILETNHDA
ncbi:MULTISPECIES: HPr family phosphocarrier protein [Arthrobacter]|uniref:Phosphocarrier protein HPr n=1 Tax=Arthrobacter psychrochitiniphilus TaxID=291045 RepID=A0A2V3DSW4_9MICC|nr:HPr family phosphocarrier protein [Arthrobacter psychrochitiniphilus]NYG19049.1 phosphocarrier protein [Arthrobacter psychrochitiniphilus]PXA65976.1 HPr family phosphocarrier protein [Arthrobacter psychrochitiniphilus]